MGPRIRAPVGFSEELEWENCRAIVGILIFLCDLHAYDDDRRQIELSFQFISLTWQMRSHVRQPWPGKLRSCALRKWKNSSRLRSKVAYCSMRDNSAKKVTGLHGTPIEEAYTRSTSKASTIRFFTSHTHATTKPGLTQNRHQATNSRRINHINLSRLGFSFYSRTLDSTAIEQITTQSPSHSLIYLLNRALLSTTTIGLFRFGRIPFQNIY